MDWLATHGASLLVGAAVVVAVVIVLIRMVKNKRNGRSSCHGCDGCPMNGHCDKQ